MSLFALCWLASDGLHGASLALSNQFAVPGQVVMAALSFSSGGRPASGIQFDITADPSLSLALLPGAQIGASAKILYTAVLPRGATRVLILGMNQSGVGDGDLLRLVISIGLDAPLGTAQVRLTNVLATDADGNAVPLPASSAAVQVQSGGASQGGAGQNAFTGESIFNAASLAGGAISPGEIVTIMGRADLAGVSGVQVNGGSAPILYAGPGQVNAIIPFGIDQDHAANLELRTTQGTLGTVPLPVAAVSPALFTQTANGTGSGAILNQDFTPNSFSTPAARGSTIMFYGTGFGALVPPAKEGQIAAGPASTALPVTATIDGVPAEVTYAGAAPALVGGVVQINVRVPPDIAANPVAAVSLAIGGVKIPAGVTVSVR